MNWEILKTDLDYQNPYFKVHKDKCKMPNGKLAKYYKIERPDAAIIAAFTEKNEIVLVNHYRHPIQSTDLELPAGMVDPNETDPEKTAKRELLEETGHQCKTLIKISENFTSSGLLSNTLHCYIGFGAEKIAEPRLDENEQLELNLLPWKEALKEFEKNAIKDLGSAHCFLLAKEYLAKHS